MRELHELELPPNEQGWELTEFWIEENGWKARAYNFTKPGDDNSDNWQIRIFDPKGGLVWVSENGYKTIRDWRWEADRMLTIIMASATTQ